MTNIPQEYSLSVVVFSECYQSYIILLPLVADLVKRHLGSYGCVSIALSILYFKSIRFFTPNKIDYTLLRNALSGILNNIC